VSGRTEVALVSEQGERDIGAEEAQKVAATIGLVANLRLAAYVNEVGQRVAAHSPRREVAHTFQVLDMPEPNAFSLPGGYVYVSRGLLVLLNSEDEVAGVLGHEIGHVAARHAVQRVTRAAPIGIVSGLGAAVTGMVSPLLGDLIGGAGKVTNALVLSPYGRDQEREADRVGAEIAAAAGYDPAALATALRTLERSDALEPEGSSKGLSFFAMHPPLPERVSTVRGFVGEFKRAATPPIVASREAFLDRLSGLVVGGSAADGVFEGQTLLHPDLGVAFTFPEGWETENARDAVGARDPKREAMIVLEVAGKGDDPEQVLAALDKESKTDVAARAERPTIAGQRAVHVKALARTDQGSLAVDLTLIAYGGRIFQVTGASRPPTFERYGETFSRATRSFRPLAPAERGRIRETRLRSTRARTGETLADVVQRSHSEWKVPMTAVANGLEESDRLAAGQLVKIAVREPYAAEP
jgi:predicted Zn-dependent protease